MQKVFSNLKLMHQQPFRLFKKKTQNEKDMAIKSKWG